MDPTQSQKTLRAMAILAGSAAVIVIGLGDRIPTTFSILLAAGGIAVAALVLWLSNGKAFLHRNEHISTEFRGEVERYLTEVAMGGNPDARRARSVAAASADDMSVPEADKPRRPGGEARSTSGAKEPREARPARCDVLGKITENVEVLGGYREELIALLQLYRNLESPRTAPQQRSEILSEIKRFEKTIALPFLLEDSEAVQGETNSLVDDLRRWLRHGAVETASDESWSPVDLHSRVEGALDGLSGDRARACWFQRHYGEIPLCLTRPNALSEVFAKIFDYFVDKVGPGQPIHIRTARRGEYAWIGIGAAPGDASVETTSSDPRIIDSEVIWNDLGGKMTVSTHEVRLLLPLHGPAQLYHEEPKTSAQEKTG